MNNSLLKNRSLYYLLFLPLFANFFFNVIFNNLFLGLKINPYNLISTLFLFIHLFIIGYLFKILFNFQSLSIGILLYLFSFFIFDSTVLFFTYRATTRIRYGTGKCTGVTKKERNGEAGGRRQKEKKKRG